MKKCPQKMSVKWYICLIAAYYAFVCGSWLIISLGGGFAEASAQINLLKQIICLGSFVSAILYFIRPAIGLLGLLFCTLVTIVSAGFDAQINAILFHFIILCVLLPSLISFLKQRYSLNGYQTGE
ncbi:MAG: hypothetical protein DRP56_00645 [Planctomycetota bacterium]|nr:MAG: hypothetical protein DRP56_00645 [Planctomycetota bacterium]